jgi:multisubunit Na+/H+ antiporter MnhB subunit
MILAIIASIVVFTYWAYYRVVYKREKEAWTDIERVAILLVVFLIVLWFILR